MENPATIKLRSKLDRVISVHPRIHEANCDFFQKKQQKYLNTIEHEAAGFHLGFSKQKILNSETLLQTYLEDLIEQNHTSRNVFVTFLKNIQKRINLVQQLDNEVCTHQDPSLNKHLSSLRVMRNDYQKLAKLIEEQVEIIDRTVKLLGQELEKLCQPRDQEKIQAGIEELLLEHTDNWPPQYKPDTAMAGLLARFLDTKDGNYHFLNAIMTGMAKSYGIQPTIILGKNEDEATYQTLHIT